VLKDIYDFMTLQQSIVFVEMKAEADNVAAMMRQAGFEVG
jgi:superfamily II DNA/RNA helicase